MILSSSDSEINCDRILLDLGINQTNIGISEAEVEYNADESKYKILLSTFISATNNTDSNNHKFITTIHRQFTNLWMQSGQKRDENSVWKDCNKSNVISPSANNPNLSYLMTNNDVNFSSLNAERENCTTKEFKKLQPETSPLIEIKKSLRKRRNREMQELHEPIITDLNANPSLLLNNGIAEPVKPSRLQEIIAETFTQLTLTFNGNRGTNNVLPTLPLTQFVSDIVSSIVTITSVKKDDEAYKEVEGAFYASIHDSSEIVQVEYS